ncbi:unnamed protein product [Closterium sp. NIES-54]
MHTMSSFTAHFGPRRCKSESRHCRPASTATDGDNAEAAASVDGRPTARVPTYLLKCLATASPGIRAPRYLQRQISNTPFHRATRDLETKTRERGHPTATRRSYVSTSAFLLPSLPRGSPLLLALPSSCRAVSHRTPFRRSALHSVATLPVPPLPTTSPLRSPLPHLNPFSLLFSSNLSPTSPSTFSLSSPHPFHSIRATPPLPSSFPLPRRIHTSLLAHHSPPSASLPPHPSLPLPPPLPRIPSHSTCLPPSSRPIPPSLPPRVPSLFPEAFARRHLASAFVGTVVTLFAKPALNGKFVNVQAPAPGECLTLPPAFNGRTESAAIAWNVKSAASGGQTVKLCGSVSLWTSENCGGYSSVFVVPGGWRQATASRYDYPDTPVK